MNKPANGILGKSIQQIKSIGESRARLFHKLGVYTVYDMLTYFPAHYEDRTSMKKIAELENGDMCAFEGYIASEVSSSRPRKGLTLYKLRIKDETGSITATWFNTHYIKNVFKAGESYIFYGKITGKFKKLEVQNPVYERLSGDGAKNICRIVPVYPSTAELSQNVIRTAIRNAVQMAGDCLTDNLPGHIRHKYQLETIDYCIRNIHFPESDEAFKNARKRLVFEELLVLQLGLLSVKDSFEHNRKGIIFKPVDELKVFLDRLPFKLTDAQARVFREIENDMESPKVMNRLVQGDVGSGKTIVAVLSLFKAVKNGFQGAFMVPTEILAEQHYKSLSTLFEGYGIRVGLLTGSLGKKQKVDILKDISAGDIDMVIGTHSLIEEAVSFAQLGLVVTDEQHRFGVRQRAELLKKGLNPDVLVMTATPIPRTLALILYGDMDISVIDQLPPGRKPVETYPVDDTKRERINNFIRRQVAEGRQVYVVCPLVEDSEEISAESASHLAGRMSRQEFRDLRVGLIHGRMKPADKDETMRRFSDGALDILVSTTVIEVGVNVPNATLMVIENAERFGLAQLHQLRGRVGRGEHKSYCVLYNNSDSRIASQRMKIMQETNDGFVISEKDLELRGPGDFFGTRQHGIPDLKIANLYKDVDILKLAQEAAAGILKADRALAGEENSGLRAVVTRKFANKLKDIHLN